MGSRKWGVDSIGSLNIEPCTLNICLSSFILPPSSLPFRLPFPISKHQYTKDSNYRANRTGCAWISRRASEVTIHRVGGRRHYLPSAVGGLAFPPAFPTPSDRYTSSFEYIAPVRNDLICGTVRSPYSDFPNLMVVASAIIASRNSSRANTLSPEERIYRMSLVRGSRREEPPHSAHNSGPSPGQEK